MELSKKKALFILILITTIFVACNDKQNHEKQIGETVFITTNAVGLQRLFPDPCDTISIEFDGLYPIIDTLPSASFDSLLLDNYLKDLGFKVISTGWGNWEKGPRIFEMKLSKGGCECSVLKKYYYENRQSDGGYTIRVAEKIVCNQNRNAVE